MSERIDVDALLAAVDIVEVVGKRVDLKKRGKDYVACCPFHQDNSPSLHVTESKQFYYCYGCGANGNALDFILDYDHVSFLEGVDILSSGRPPKTNGGTPHVPRERRDETYDGYTPVYPVPETVPTLQPNTLTPPIVNPSKVGEPGYTPKGWRPSMVFPYRLATGELYGYVVRLDFGDGKKITPAVMWCKQPDGSHAWTLYPFPTPRPLYNLNKLIQNPDRQVLIVEGEKCAAFCDDLIGDRVVVTTWCGGTHAVQNTDYGALRGRRVVLCGDRDDPGLFAMREIESALARIQVANIKRVAHQFRSPKGFDLADLDIKKPAELFAYLKQQAVDEFPDTYEVDPDPEQNDEKNDPEQNSSKSVPETSKVFSSVSDSTDWRKFLMLDDRGKTRSNIHNAQLMLWRHEDLEGVLRYNTFAKTVDIVKEPPWDTNYAEKVYPRRLTDVDDTRATAWLERHNCKLQISTTHNVIISVAWQSPYNPLQDWLRGLEWDGQLRLHTAIPRFFGATRNEYTEAVSRRWLVGAVARALDPGCKNDTMLILEGPQGLKKSSAVEALFGDNWYADELSDMGSKDASMQMQGVWCIEVAELSTMHRAETSRLKEFLTRRVDRFRPPYGRNVMDAPRQCVLVGTVNPEGGYLRDATGGRRFWPIRCGKIDFEKIVAERDQVWAEAVRAYLAGERWWFDHDERHIALRYQQERYESDPWEDDIVDYVEPMTMVSIKEILEHLEIPQAQRTQATQTRIAKTLVSMGWRRQQKRFEGKPRWMYIKCEEEL